MTTPWPIVVTRSVWVESPRADSGRATPIREAAAEEHQRREQNEPESSHDLHTPPRGFLSHMRYQFVDCRWSLDDPGLGRRLYLEAHIPGAAFLDVERDLSAPPGTGGPASAARGRAVRGRGRRGAGIGPERSVVAYGSLGGAERLWWLLRHFGHDDVRGDRPRGVARPAPRRRGADRAAGVRRRSSGTATRSAATSSRRAARSSSSSTPACPARWRGEPNPLDRVPGRIPGALNAPWNEEPPALPAGELVAYCGSGVTACVVLHRLHLAGREGLPLPGLVVGVGAVSGTAGRAFCVGESLRAGHPADRRHRTLPRLRQLGVVVARRPGRRARPLGARR